MNRQIKSELSVITANISADFLTPPGVPTWDERKFLYVQTLRDAGPTLIGLQEVTPRQFEFLQAQLPEFTALTVSPKNPDPRLLEVWQAKYGKFGFDAPPDPYEVVLFYHRGTVEQLASGYWWLSPTPEYPSIGFGNTAPRVMVWAHLLHRASGREFFVFNTHIDHRCTHPMVALCREKFSAFAARDLPLLFLGDLNFNPSDANYALLCNDGWRDAHDVTSGPDSTTFLYDMPDIPGGRIDHVLCRGAGLVPVSWARLFSPDPTRRLSDHDPVQVRLLWTND